MAQLPVTSQPMSLKTNQTAQPVMPLHTTSGLDILTAASEVLVNRESGSVKIGGVDFVKRYVVTNLFGRRLFDVNEPVPSFGWSQCWECRRRFTLHVRDQQMNELFSIHRPGQKCCSCCTPVDEMVVHRSGQLIGQVEEECACCCPGYRVKASSSDQQLSVRGQCCPGCCDCISENVFEVTNFNGASVGTITKMGKGCCDDFLNMYISRSFTVQFYQSDVETKMLLLTACFFINQTLYSNDIYIASGGKILAH